MARSTRAAVATSTLRVRLTTCETVDVETPACRATSAMVATPILPLECGRPGFAVCDAGVVRSKGGADVAHWRRQQPALFVVDPGYGHRSACASAFMGVRIRHLRSA